MSTRRHEAFEALQDAVRRNDLSVIEGLLADDVRWYGNGPGGCHNREQVLATLRAQLEHGIRPLLEEAGAEGDRLLLRVRLSGGGRSRPTRTRRFGSRSRSTRRAASSSCRTTRAGLAERDIAVRARGPVAGAPSPPISGLVPFVEVRDVGRSVAFYRLLGLVLRETHEHDGRLVWALMGRDSVAVMLAQIEAPIDPGAQGVFFYLYVRDLVGLRQHLVAYGLTPGEIVDGSPGPRREMRVTDPDGYCLMVAQIEDEANGRIRP
jgi:hypothetical protein